MAIILVGACIVLFIAIAGLLWLALSSLFGFGRGFVNGYYDGNGYREPRLHRHARHGHHDHHDHGHGHHDHGHGHHRKKVDPFAGMFDKKPDGLFAKKDGHHRHEKKVDPFAGMFDKKPAASFAKKDDHHGHHHHGRGHKDHLGGGGAKKKW